ncbi:hypothetical protein [Methylobacterium longum]|uniref:Uncharacterized protein n=1 Tax=Methylobacterium longum TaxID=767694 RepID=A0ABT8ASF0_9HYPH|nr:hypothetical protein [Methylobacterium longum]MDN3572341.1 hypothetical protein [Methylobacterium longum]GJE09515.1 hypothetical protein FOHLNKBM_0539 [Methylobacterium longum]
MNFTVIARTQSSETTFHHASLLNAISQGMSLSASGKADVRIADGDGLSRTPAELFRLMFGRSGVESACNPTIASVATPFAA